MGDGPEASGDLWRSLAAEIDRLTIGRARGKSFSEDFAVDRVCSAIAKLRQQHERQEAEERSAEEMRGLRVELAMEEQRLRIQQGKLEDVRAQIRQAQGVKDELQQELEAEEAGRREASEGQAKQWKEAAYRTHLCLNSLRSKEAELAQLQAVLDRPQELDQAWDGLVRKLQSELEVGRAEELEARRESEKLILECSKAERELASMNVASGTGIRASGALLQFGGQGPAAAPPKDDRDPLQDELLRIASRADDREGSLLQVADGGAFGLGGVAASRAPWSSLPQHGTAPRPGALAAEQRDLSSSLQSAGAVARPLAAPTVRSSSRVLDEAQRVLEKMDRLQAWRNPPPEPGAPTLFH